MRPTTSATRPPMPASTSSKISPGADALGGRSVGVAEAVPRRRGQRLDREHDARQLAAGDDARQRPQLLARVGRDEELGRVDAARRSTPTSGSGASSNRTSNRVRSIASSASSASSCRGERRRDAAPLAATARRRRRGTPRAPRRSSRSSSRDPLVAALEIGQLAPQRVAPGDDLGQRRPVLALQPLEQRQPFLDLLQPRRRGLDAVGVLPQETRRDLRAAT